VQEFLARARAELILQTGDPAASQQLALQSLGHLRQTQASALAYFDTFFVFAVVSAGLVALVLLMKRSVAEKGTRIGAE
jgi:MFS transporter, DHA2 family, multidrug resistance protein